ncbi:alpha/beta hydrolase, partial [Candidatus Micrarchaeota archaeon]|nr:alpha/beta hydrolase [Candidatus Micrarchaeota archaeon]
MNEEPVYFDNNKGQRLIGMRHVPKGRPPYPTVIIFHGLTGNKAEVHFKYTRLARLLCEHGFQVYRFDFRGHGDSWGNFSQIIMDDLVKDTKDIFNFVRQQKSTDRTRMGVVSLSLCPGLYIRLTSKDVKAMVLHSPAAYPKTTVERGWGIGVRYGRSGPSSLVYNPNFWKSLDKYNAFTSITYADMPIILIC